MIRTQACVSFMLLLAIRSSEGFATPSIVSSNGQQRQRSRFTAVSTASAGYRQQEHRVTPRKRPLPTPSTSSTSTPATLFSDATYNVNNRHSSNDYWYNIKTLPSSAILRDIRNPVLAVFGWSTAVSVVHFVLSRLAAASSTLATTHTTSLWATMATKMCVSPAAHSFLVSALGLLLVFRTNSAYQRFSVSSS